MRVFPWDKVVADADAKMKASPHVHIYQQFNCEHCGAKQTMDTPDIFYETGTCEECKKITNIKKNGMNFMMHLGRQ